ncbi:hypothetical protein LMG28140_01188 [Paraburkholderia metrosideri]|uniref:Uncharacterized protein n=1 Tax=Paraburkholderia metrosideri TaxID=580937 RepID=A0ABM8NDX7_9BURK|nr:hypothetical protein LMG28140_01188 [Paraburkholderia metrosideri]
MQFEDLHLGNFSPLHRRRDLLRSLSHFIAHRRFCVFQSGNLLLSPLSTRHHLGNLLRSLSHCIACCGLRPLQRRNLVIRFLQRFDQTLQLLQMN